MIKNFKRLPSHIAIIPDGNRRWARKRGLAPHIGHIYGGEAFERILKYVYKLKIPYLTLWVGSLDNFLKRPKREVEVLFGIYEDKIKQLRDSSIIHKEKVKVRIYGYWRDYLPPYIKKLFEEIIETTKNYGKYNLTFLVGYNGDLEMLDCIKNLVLTQENVNPHFDEEKLRKYLMTGELPPIDLLIRTGGEAHLSAGFMMWHTRYSQLYFSRKLWPDFNSVDLKRVLKIYSKRERRFGG